jgi:hypothetical protein
MMRVGVGAGAWSRASKQIVSFIAFVNDHVLYSFIRSKKVESMMYTGTSSMCYQYVIVRQSICDTK